MSLPPNAFDNVVARVSLLVVRVIFSVVMVRSIIVELVDALPKYLTLLKTFDSEHFCPKCSNTLMFVTATIDF